MNETEVERQIDQMVKFIKQEADEKANEIAVSAEEEFNIEKLQLLEAEKAKIRKDYERREGQIDVKKKIEYSKQLNESRLKVLQARENAVHELINEAQQGLTSFSKDQQKYKGLLADLLVQAFAKLSEPSVIVKVRDADQGLAKDALEDARSKFKGAFGKDGPDAKLDTKSFLPAASSGKEGEDSCCGGVVVSSADGKIVCANTLDERLKIAYAQNLPMIRGEFFGIEAPVRAEMHL
ncbi:hypothetical protein ABBQ38_014481 [Trebouxia sp. C0009 RCD-2024]